MVDLNAPGRDLTRFLLPEVGRLVETGEPQDPYRLLDPAGLPVVPVTSFFAELQAASRPATTVRSYGMDLLTWYRFLWAVDIAWDLGPAEQRAFWAWASVEFLRHTGVRIEEMLEASHHSITQYRLPTTGEVVPLLQIAPSKTDEERLHLVSPELADVLSAMVCRVRDASGAIPLVRSYDLSERAWNPPLPLLFQWRWGGQNRPVSVSTIRKGLEETLLASGLADSTGQPLRYQPHDFRRIFVTDAIMSGLPPHIAQVICGHKTISTTMSYKAVYPTEAIEAHRAFIARRRALRPSEEYRTPTSEEWDAFLAHFEKRKLSVGTCARAFGTACVHEHACFSELAIATRGPV